MRGLTALAIVVALGGPACAQGLPPIGIPMGAPEKEKPVDPVKENDYRSAIGGMPTPKAADPWGNVREAPSGAPAAATAAKDGTKTSAKTKPQQ